MLLLLIEKLGGIALACPERGPDPPFSWTPLFISDPLRPTQPDLTDKCNVNCFLIV